MYISKSTDGGKTWTQVARVDSEYFDADIGEGQRNGLAVSPGGTDFVITTQEGAFQVIPQPSTSAAVVKSIVGPRVPHPDPKVTIPKKEGDPVRAGVVVMTADGKHMIVGYGYFDLNPQIFTYHRDAMAHGSKMEHSPLFQPKWISSPCNLMTQEKPHPGSLYVGTGDQAYRLNLRTKKWTRLMEWARIQRSME